nr:hypothetical protein CFP56_08451 [Quercus suber]
MAAVKIDIRNKTTVPHLPPILNPNPKPPEKDQTKPNPPLLLHRSYSVPASKTEGDNDVQRSRVSQRYWCSFGLDDRRKGGTDTKAARTHAMFAPYILKDLRPRVLSPLHVGVSVETIMQRHSESVVREGGPSNRDDQLSHWYVRRQERSIQHSTYELNADDAVSIGMWVASHQNHIFFYEDFSDSEPFTLGIQIEWQLQQMSLFGNCSLLVYDSRFRTNKLKEHGLRH